MDSDNRVSTSSFVAHEKGDRPPSLKGRRPVMSTVEMFLWRNYLIFLSCTAPPSTSLQASLMSSGDRWVWSGETVGVVTQDGWVWLGETVGVATQHGRVWE